MDKTNLILGLFNVSCALLTGGLAIPLIKEKVKMNHFYGIRFAKSFESDENWFKINKRGGSLLLRWSIIVLLIGLTCFVQPKIEPPLLWLFAFAPLLYIIACIQSYLYARTL